MARLSASNFAISTLASAATVTDTTFTIDDNHDVFPDTPFRIVLGDGIDIEIVEITSKTGSAPPYVLDCDNLSNRGLEDTEIGGSGLDTWAIGTPVEGRLTAGMYNELSYQDFDGGEL